MICPQCKVRIVFDNHVWNGDFVCQQCGASLLVSETYSRVLILTSSVLGFGLPWVAHLPKILIASLGDLVGFVAVLALGFPIAFTVLFLMVRVVPQLISPPLVLRHEGALTVLNLGVKQKSQNSDN